jgi:uncharacterized membrane protein YkoI
LPPLIFRVLVVGFCVLVAAAPAGAERGRGGDDQERAWQARRTGAVLPIELILDRVLKDYPGEIVEIDFDDEDDGFIYEIKVLTRRGIVLEIDVDAATGRILDLEEDD